MNSEEDDYVWHSKYDGVFQLCKSLVNLHHNEFVYELTTKLNDSPINANVLQGCYRIKTLGMNNEMIENAMTDFAQRLEVLLEKKKLERLSPNDIQFVSNTIKVRCSVF